MSTPIRHLLGSLEAAGAVASIVDADGAYMEFDSGSSFARFGAKGTAGTSRGVKIRTLNAGAAVDAVSYAADGTPTFAKGPTITAGGITVSAGTSAFQAVTATSLKAPTMRSADSVTVATSSGVAATALAFSGLSNNLYIVQANWGGGLSQAYAIVCYQAGAALSILAQGTAGTNPATFSVSGTNLQLTQSAGSITYTVTYLTIGS